MSKTTIALEAAVATVIENTPGDEARPTARQRLNVDRAFAQILKLIAPRIRHFIRQYGLSAHWDDAEQCCAIAVHRAIQAYDPAKAQFTTFVNWQIRGELQSLRFRLMTDQRPSAKKVDATTVSLHAVAVGAEGEETTLESLIEDSESLFHTEAAASDYLAKRATASLIEEYVRTNRASGIDQLRRAQPKRALAKARAETRFRDPLAGIDKAEIEKLDEKLARDKEILERRVFGETVTDEAGEDSGITKERIRQIGKRASKVMAELALSSPKFRVMAEAGTIETLRRIAPTLAQQVSLLPDPNTPANRASQVVAVDPSSADLLMGGGNVRPIAVGDGAEATLQGERVGPAETLPVRRGGMGLAA